MLVVAVVVVVVVVLLRRVLAYVVGRCPKQKFRALKSRNSAYLLQETEKYSYFSVIQSIYIIRFLLTRSPPGLRAAGFVERMFHF